MGLNIEVFENGSYSISTGSLTLEDCYPGIDGRPVKPLSIIVETGNDIYTIEYKLSQGILKLVLRTNTYDDIFIEPRLIGFSTKPYSVQPFLQAKLLGTEGIYRQGVSLGGPSGYSSIKALLKEGSRIDSYGVTAIKGKQGYLFISGSSHHQFINVFTIEFYKSVFMKSEKTWECITSEYRLENVIGGNVELPTVCFYSGNNLEAGLVLMADRIGTTMKSRKPKKPAFHWCSWYYLYDYLSHEILKEYLEGFSKLQPQIPFKYIQIDAGYHKNLGDWLETNELWPDGLQAAFNDIREYGYKPAIWVAPFLVGNRSKLYVKNPEWILYKTDGEPIKWPVYNEPKMWSSRNEEYYVLDTSHPEVMQYLRTVFRTMKNWGAELFKVDFMRWGLQDSSSVKRFKLGKTSVEYFREVLQMIREEIGEESYLLGCISPLLPAIGYMDGMRFAGDVGAQWNGTLGPINMIRELPAANYFNHIYWQNDPDSIILRDFHTHLKPHESEAVGLLQALSGGIVTTSDPIHEISDERKALLTLFEPKYIIKPEYPFLGEERKEIVLINRLPQQGKYLLFFFNPTQDDICECYNIKQLIGIEKGYFYLWKTEKPVSHFAAELLVRMPSHGCCLYFMADNPFDGDKISNLWEWK